MDALIGNAFKTKTGMITLQELLDNCSVLGVYFSAHWCPPCKAFTPVLAEFYNQANANGKKIEIIFGTCDKSESEFESYYNDMPWAAIPHGDAHISGMMQKFGITGIPHLMIMKKDGTVIVENARNEVQSQGPGIVTTWEQKASS